MFEGSLVLDSPLYSTEVTLMTWEEGIGSAKERPARAAKATTQLMNEIIVDNVEQCPSRKKSSDRK